MKYVNIRFIKNVMTNISLIFIAKKMFFDDYISLGIFDKHYGITFFTLLLILVSCQLLEKKINEK